MLLPIARLPRNEFIPSWHLARNTGAFLLFAHLIARGKMISFINFQASDLKQIIRINEFLTGGQTVKNPPAIRETSSDPLKLGGLWEVHGNPLVSIPAWRVPTDRGAGRLQSTVAKESDTTERPSTP